jgi:hypothetical protein
MYVAMRLQARWLKDEEARVFDEAIESGVHSLL